MNMNSLEQLRNIGAPTPDPAARLRAKRAAMAEFRRIHNAEERKPATSAWSWKSPWLGGFATAGVVVIGVSLAWFTPDQDLQAPADATVARAIDAAPAVTATAPEARPIVTQPETVASAANASSQSQQPTVGTEPAAAVQPARQASLMKSATEANDEQSEATAAGARTQAPGSTAANPITSITGNEVRQLGLVNTSDALLQLVPQNLSQSAPSVSGNEQGQDRSSFFVGNTIANLREMDPTFGTRTLTLVDGRRTVSTSNQADVVDLNMIPSNLLQRRDVVPGGASVAGSPPATTGRFQQFEINPIKRVADEPVSTFSIDVDTASYSYARRMLNQLGANQNLPPMDAVRVEEMINYFDYSWPAPTSRNEPLRPTITVSDSPWAKGRKLVHIGIKGYELPARSKPDVNLVLLMDVSGSMAPADRLPLAKQSVALLLDSLKPTDTVAIAVYAGAAGMVLPPTPVRNRAAIQQALDRLQSGGSTAGAQGIQLAYNLAQQGFRQDGINRILLATDGDFNVGIRDRNELKQLVERERAKGIYLSVLGFGQGNYRDEVAQTLAQNGNGVAAYIDTLQEARKVLVQEATSALFTIASDVKIQVEFNPATVAEYRLIGYETRALAHEDFNNDKVDAGDVGSGHRVTAIYEITPVGSGAQLIDERRYSAIEKPAGDARIADDARGRGNEYGFLKIRYKLPGESESRLMQQPIRQDAGVPAAVRSDVSFSTAVAGFAQLLRGGKYTGSLSYDDVIRQAQSSLGRDEFGYRTEFVLLARKARDVGMPTCINSAIQSLTDLVNTHRQRVDQAQRTYNEQHAQVLAAKAGLASAEASLAAEVARLSSQGVTCPTRIPD